MPEFLCETCRWSKDKVIVGRDEWGEEVSFAAIICGRDDEEENQDILNEGKSISECSHYAKKGGE